MDVPNIKSGGIDHHERPVEIARPDTHKKAAPGQHRDSATISQDGRETLKAVDRLTDLAKGSESDRAQLVADAKARLDRGDLAAPDVFRSVADRILRDSI